MRKLSIAALALTAMITTVPMTSNAAAYTYIKTINGQSGGYSQVVGGQGVQNGNCPQAADSQASNCIPGVNGQNIDCSDIVNSLKDYSSKCKIFINGSSCTDPSTCTQGTNCPQAEVTKPEAAAPEASKPEAAQPEASKPAQKPEASAPETVTTPEQEATFEQQVLDLVNQERQKAGLKALVMNAKAQQAAEVRAKEIQTTFSHTRPNGASFSTALKESGASYRGAGENIAWGQTSPEEVMEAWMNSAGHRANILNADYTSMGVGHDRSAAATDYWTQLFVY